MDAPMGGPASSAVEDAIASVTATIDAQADQAKESVAAVRVRPS
jgi:hypothetical protein